MALSPQNRARQTALYWLARREYAYAELVQKLQKKHVSSEDIEAVLTSLVESGLQSDLRFAESFTRSRQQRGQGPVRITYELRARGIAQEIIEQAVNITDNAWFTLVHEVWRRHFKGKPPTTPAERAKQTRFLHYRGFTSDHINSLKRSL